MKFKKGVAVSLLPLNVLLLFFLCFSSKIVVPAWLQVPGRLHPLLLHFPIVLILLFAAWLLFAPQVVKKSSWYVILTDGLLLSAAFATVVTALTGFLLSKEEGYETGTVDWHKWLGAALSFLLLAVWNFRQQIRAGVIYNLCMVGVVVVLLVAAHLGGNLTHGHNFVLAPLMPEKAKVLPLLDDALVYADVVAPILQSKCMSCHNESKAKGQLCMETPELLLKGGKSGVLWDTTRPDLGLLMQRVHLPEAARKHMPPIGKPQLTAFEIGLLQAWIRGGAFFDKRVMELPDSDTFKTLAATLFHQTEEAVYDFEPADDRKVKELNNNNRVIMPLAAGSPALVVNFYNRSFYAGKELDALQPLAAQIVDLSLDKMPVKDEDLAIIARFRNLRKLNLNFTGITGKTIGALKNLQQLKQLSLAGTPVTAGQLKPLLSLPHLKTVYIWSTGIAGNDLGALQQAGPAIRFYTGFKDTVTLKINEPFIENEEQVLTAPVPLKLKHYVKGAEIRYTLDGKDPDSISSPVYKEGVLLGETGLVKARAFKAGWIGSGVVKKQFYQSTWRADTATLFPDPDRNYKGRGGPTIIDQVKSDLNYGNGKWVGFHGPPVTAVLYFNKPVPVSRITISMLQSVNEHVFPPASVQVWGGRDKNHLTLLSTIRPPLPAKEDRERGSITVDSRFGVKEVGCIKLLFTPVADITGWVNDKKARSWLFIDEVFVN